MKSDNCSSNNICLCISPYALLLYMLVTEEEMMMNGTLYVLGKGVSRAVCERLSGIYIDTINGNSIKDKAKRFVSKLQMRGFWRRHGIDVQNHDIFAQDHAVLSILLRDVNYKLLSDGPKYFSINMQEDSTEYRKLLAKRNSLEGKLARFFYGNVAVCPFGDNEQCKEIYLTEEDHSPVLKNKILHVNSFQELWNNSSEKKRAFINSVFDISLEDVSFMNRKSVIFFSQPLVADGIMSDSDYRSLLKGIFSRYDHDKLLIKTHPRDKYDYKSLFPDVEVYEKSVNAQLLMLNGLNVERVATIFSSSVDSFPESVEVDWFANAHPVTKLYCGSTQKPHRKYNDILSL